MYFLCCLRNSSSCLTRFRISVPDETMKWKKNPKPQHGELPTTSVHQWLGCMTPGSYLGSVVLHLHRSSNQEEEQPRKDGEEDTHRGEHEGQAVAEVKLEVGACGLLLVHILIHKTQNLDPDDEHHNDS